MEPARRTLAHLKPDLFLAQEIRDWEAFDCLIRAHPPLRVNVVSSFRSTDTGELWPQQLAIASCLPCVAAWAEPFRATIPGIPRGPAVTALRTEDGAGVVLVYSVHLKSNRSRNDKEAAINFLWRDESATQLLAHIAEMERVTFKGKVRGVIIAGDFNTNHDGQFGDRVVDTLVVAGFHNTWAKVPKENRLTWRGNQQFPPVTFDYILTRDLGEPEAQLIEIPDGISDHWPVKVVVDF